MEETFRRLKPRRGVGPSGRHNEYLTALVGHFDDPRAAVVMQRYDAFASAFVNSELPSWFYVVEAAARLQPLVKAAATTPGGDPDVRPVAVGEVDTCAFTKAAYAGFTHTAFAEYLAPQQLAVGIPGGLSILVHGVRALLRMRPDFVVVRLDLRNAYNEIDRAVLLERMAAVEQLGPLAKFFHTMHAAESPLYLGNRTRLFGGVDGHAGDSAAGVRQGSVESSAAFCVGIHPELVTLHGRLLGAGGGAWGDMDDIYAVGPARQVFEAVHEFTVAVGDGATAADRGLGLVLRPEKLQCYSPGYDQRPRALPLPPAARQPAAPGPRSAHRLLRGG